MNASQQWFSPKRLALALALGLWLYFLLPITAAAFYELYHLLPLAPFYWLYGGLKAGSYYFDQWPYKSVVCVLAAALVLAPGMLRAAFAKN